MRLAFSTNAFKKFPLADAIKSIGKIGYEGVELLCDVPHAYPPDFGQDKIKETRKLLSDLNLAISNLNAFTLYAIGDVYLPSWIESDEKRRQQRVSHTLGCIRMAKELGATCLSVEPGGPFAQGMDRNALEKLFLRGLNEVRGLAERLSIKILVEPEPGLLIENSEQFLKIIKEINSDVIGLNFDIGHFYCVKENPAELVYKLSDYAKHYHLEDISASRVHQHLIPGHGSIDFISIFKALESTGYKGFVTVELYPYQDDPETAAKSAFDYLAGKLPS